MEKPTHPLIGKALASTPIADLIGFTIGEVGDGRATASLQPGPQHANPMGTLHGRVLCDLSDAAMGMAFVSTLAPEESFTTPAMAPTVATSGASSLTSTAGVLNGYANPGGDNTTAWFRYGTSSPGKREPSPPK